ncbi:hypothetical protein [Sinorhizobium meliloti]|uniref:hypothetical protein n=1 Tax=Rhizobium meliloti TaxID=382 RepID=UPI0013E3675F|nr:hypothetical protein [Sinorhizobium meliloti]
MGIEQAPTAKGKQSATGLRKSAAKEEKKTEAQKGSDLRVGLEKVSTISISCKASGEHADVGDGDPRFC